MTELSSCIYEGTVVHKRLVPRQHGFSYRVFALCLDVDEIDEAACRRLGYTWTRRPTGGKAILHTDEATYSLIIPQDDQRIQGGASRE